MQKIWNVRTNPAVSRRTTEEVAKEAGLIDVASNPRAPIMGWREVTDPDSETAPMPLNETLKEFLRKKTGAPPRDPLEQSHISLERRQQGRPPTTNYSSEIGLDRALARLEEQNIDLAILRVGIELDAAERRARARRAPTFYRSQVRSDPREPGIPFHDYYKL